jgi:regulator of protease activity HflC (stomatin/prohibitin superfamily)
VSDANDIPIRPGGPGHRPASFTLRSGADAESSAAMLDAANQSLAEALRITFWILQLGMVVIFALFLLSGFQAVRENETAIRLLFGRVTSDAPLPPGFQFSWPYPLGEMIKVNTGAVQLDLDESFWPSLTADQKKLPLQQLAAQGKGSLKPGLDGSLITADRALAHAKWTVVYTRAAPTSYAENILTEDESRIVRAAVERGVVQAVSGITIDDLLKQSSTDTSSVASRARQVAQESLDRIRSGIRIDQLTLREKTPPLPVFRSFNDVQSAEQQASQRREKAEGEAHDALNKMAGAAHPYLVARINDYEKAVELGDEPARARLMDEIERLMEGRPVEQDGRVLEALASGQVTAILNDARQYKTAVVNSRRAELAMFQAKLGQFRLNPRVVVHRDWSDALGVFLARENVEKFFNPPGMSTLEVLINRDPEIVKAIEKARKLKENIDAEKERERRFKEDRFRTDTGATVSSQ